MKILILAYNPNAIAPLFIEQMNKIFEEQFGIHLNWIPANDSKMKLPVYQVSYIETKE